MSADTSTMSPRCLLQGNMVASATFDEEEVVVSYAHAYDGKIILLF